MQEHDGSMMPIAYCARKLKSAETRYSTTEQELLGVVFCMLKWRCYLEGAPQVYLHTDHEPLTWLKTQAQINRRQSHWLEFLSRFKFEILYVKGDENVVADALSRMLELPDDEMPALPGEFWPHVVASLTRSLCRPGRSLTGRDGGLPGKAGGVETARDGGRDAATRPPSQVPSYDGRTGGRYNSSRSRARDEGHTVGSIRYHHHRLLFLGRSCAGADSCGGGGQVPEGKNLVPANSIDDSTARMHERPEGIRDAAGPFSCNRQFSPSSINTNSRSALVTGVSCAPMGMPAPGGMLLDSPMMNESDKVDSTELNSSGTAPCTVQEPYQSFHEYARLFIDLFTRIQSY